MTTNETSGKASRLMAAKAILLLLAGASAIQIGTVLFSDPYAPSKICRGINDYLDGHGIASVTELIGAIEPW